jgi:hypothetical protein
MKRTIKLTEEDLNKIIGKILNEQDMINVNDLKTPGGLKLNQKNIIPQRGDKYGESRGPGKEFKKGDIVPSVTMPSNLFKNGIDKIDVNSDAFKKGVEGIKKAVAANGQNIIIAVEGGASKVGSAEGYDNNALAQRRARNFVAQVQNQFPSVNFKISTKVGDATVKNSPEAEREQYVKLTFPGSITTAKTGQSVDNTQLVMRYKKPIKPVETKKVNTKTYYKVCYWVPKESFDKVMELISNVGGIEV